MAMRTRLKAHRERKRSGEKDAFMDAMLPPRPPGSKWFTGHLRDFSRDRLGYMTRCAKEFGDMTAIRLGHHSVYLANHPKYIEEVLVDKRRHFSKHFALHLNPLILGK